MLPGGQVRTQKCPLDLSTLLPLRDGLLSSSSYSVKDTNRAKSDTRTRGEDSSGLEKGRHLRRRGRDKLRSRKNQLGQEGSKPLLN